MIAIQVSLYPIGEKDIDKKLNIFWKILRAENINFKITPLNTVVWSAAGEEEEKLYNAVFKAYRMVRKTCPAVMVSTITTGDKTDIDRLLKFLK